MEKNVLRLKAVDLSYVAPISAVGVDQSGTRLVLGLSNGALEAYSLQSGGEGLTSVLTARKKLSRKAIVSICDLSACGCLAALADDGLVHVLDCETLVSQQLPVRYAMALAACLPLGHLPRLAVAAKPSQRSVHVAVYELQPTPWGVSLPLLAHIDVPCANAVASMAWAGDQLVVCTTACEYLLLAPLAARPDWRELAAAPAGDDGPARLPAVVHAVPQADAALLLVGQAGVLVDAAGSPVGSALRLEGLIGALAVAASGTHVVLAAGCCAHVYDVQTGCEIQRLPLGNSPRGAADGWPLVVGDSPSGSCVVLAKGRSVWLCLPVSLEDQVRELLARHEYAGALEATELAFRQGAPWAETACAQAALLLLQDCRFEEAVLLLERCSPLVFQPVQLAWLFPADMALWLEQVEKHSCQLWGLHQPLPALEALIDVRLQANRQQAAAMAAAVDDSTLQQRRAALARQAQQSLVPYLLRARLLDGVVCLDAVDTLVLLLLISLNADDEAAAFAATPNCVAAQAVAPQLQIRGWQHVLATLYAARGEVLGALDIWRQLAADSKAALRHEAAGCAAALLKNCSDDSLVLAHLPWLLQVSEQAATAVLAARCLPTHLALPLLAPGTGARWRFILHLIAVQGCSEPALHTELALELIAAVLRAHGGGQVASEERLCLQQHLRRSGLYDQAAVLQALQSTGLHEELVALHSRAGDHMAALHVFILELRDIVRAEAYARAHLLPNEYGALLRVALTPGPHGEPRYEDAVYLAAAMGESLDATELLRALPPGMPLCAATSMLAPLLRDRLSRRRAGQLSKALRRSLLVSACAAEHAAERHGLLVSEERACPGCHLRLGSRVFVAAIRGDVEVLCLHCWHKQQKGEKEQQLPPQQHANNGEGL